MAIGCVRLYCSRLRYRSVCVVLQLMLDAVVDFLPDPSEVENFAIDNTKSELMCFFSFYLFLFSPSLSLFPPPPPSPHQ